MSNVETHLLQMGPCRLRQPLDEPLLEQDVVVLDRSRAASPAWLAQRRATSDGGPSFSIAPVRN